MHRVSDPGITWYGGTGHRLLGVDGGEECYRCGSYMDDSAWQELIPDCEGPNSQPHFWLGGDDHTNVCDEDHDLDPHYISTKDVP